MQLLYPTMPIEGRINLKNMLNIHFLYLKRICTFDKTLNFKETFVMRSSNPETSSRMEMVIYFEMPLC